MHWRVAVVRITLSNAPALLGLSARRVRYTRWIHNGAAYDELRLSLHRFRQGRLKQPHSNAIATINLHTPKVPSRQLQELSTVTGSASLRNSEFQVSSTCLTGRNRRNDSRMKYFHRQSDSTSSAYLWVWQRRFSPTQSQDGEPTEVAP